MTLHLALTPDLEAKLRERATAEGKDPATVALEAVAEKLASSNGSQLPEVTARDRLDSWNRFVAGMREHGRSLPPDHFVDDSRDSIYRGRGE
jgi:hypothetical protein